MSSEVPPNSKPEQTTFKDRLDQAAREARQATGNGRSDTPGLMQKVAEHVPPVSKLSGLVKGSQGQHENTAPKNLPGPPNRPEHDDQIAEFVREQHRSKRSDGDPA
ncbi:hypothetical protein SAMD00023353_0902830 [Rosellinia necatrix]|uniref:Uncharacterized protein n=1 Tax=Rosellinia necatrix TaxID=77044 RepID=A0A1W2TLA1_ROSNE|nr:hypothetical protein SAMD00023353_0902830 [Rosellinia necatrix]